MHAIYCAGEQGRVVLDILRSTGEHEDIVFGDDDPNLHGESVAGRGVVGGVDELATRDEVVACVIAFGDQPGIRLDIADRLTAAGCEFFNAIHTSATISDTTSVGHGLMLNAESYLGPDVELGNHVLVDSCVSISHDVHIESGATITPNTTVAGGVVLGTDSYIGPGATVIEEVTIGEKAVVGAGAVVTSDVPPDTTVVGVPASSLEN